MCTIKSRKNLVAIGLATGTRLYVRDLVARFLREKARAIEAKYNALASELIPGIRVSFQVAGLRHQEPPSQYALRVLAKHKATVLKLHKEFEDEVEESFRAFIREAEAEDQARAEDPDLAQLFQGWERVQPQTEAPELPVEARKRV